MRNTVIRLAVAAIVGACLFLAFNPELLDVGAGASSSQFRSGECVTGFHVPGESWVIVNRMPEHVVETYLVEEVTSGRQQAIQAQRLRSCTAQAD